MPKQKTTTKKSQTKQKKSAPKSIEDATKIYSAGGKKEKSEYPLITAWCEYWHKDKSLEKEMIDKAKEDKIDKDAVYYDVKSKSWMKFTNGIFNSDLFSVLKEAYLQLQ